MARRLGQQRHVLVGDGVVLQRHVPGHGTDRQLRAFPPDAGQIGDAVEVDDGGGARQAHVEKRPRVCPPASRLAPSPSVSRSHSASSSVVGA